MNGTDFILNFDPIVVAMLSFAVIGAVKLFRSLIDRDFRAAGTIGISALVGAFLAPFAGDINWFTGLLIGLNGSGLITTASRISGTDSSAPTPIVGPSDGSQASVE